MRRFRSSQASVARAAAAPALLAVVILCAPTVSGQAAAQDPAATEAYLGLVADHFRTSPEEVRTLLRAGATAEELPVLLRISRTSGIAPAVLLTLHRRGSTWLAVAARYRLGAELFYVALGEEEVDDLVRAAHRRYRDTPEAAWSSLALPDPDVIAFANLHFLTRATGRSAGAVLSARARAGSFPASVRFLMGPP